MLHLRILTTVTCSLLLAIPARAGEKRPTGTADGNHYHDAAYGFTLLKYDNWKFGKIDQEDPAKMRLLRAIVTLKSVNYPTAYTGNEDKFNIPFIGVFVDTSEMVLDAYVAELTDRKSKRQSRKDVMKDYPILLKGSLETQESAVIDAQKAIVLHLRENYEVQLYNRLKDQYKLKEDAILGDLYITKRGNTVYLLGLACEREIFRTVNEEAKKIIMSVDLDPPADSAKGAGSAAPGQ